jgi:hypothetical protein
MRTTTAPLLMTLALLTACQSQLVVADDWGPVSGGTYGATGTGGIGGTGGSSGPFGGSGSVGIGGSPFSTQDAGGSSSTAVPAAAPAPVQLIDDMEDGTAAFASPAGLSGAWQTWSDAAVTPVDTDALIAPLDLPRPGSTRACHARPLSGSRRGVDVALALHRSPRDLSPADLSAYEGVAFWARSAAMTDLTVAGADDSVAPGHDLWSDEASGNPWPARRVSLTGRWERYVLLFEDFDTFAGDVDRRLDVRALAALHFAGGRNTPSDFWIDDVVLLCRGLCPPGR